MTTATLRPVEILQDTFQRVGAVFVPLVLLALPSAVIAVLVANSPLAGIINILYGISIAPILGGAMIILINRCLSGQTVDLGEAVAMSWRKAGALILTALLLFLILVPALLLLVIPGLYLAVRLFATQYAVVLEHKSPTEALSASWELTKGRWWSIFGTLLVIALAVMIPFVIVSALLGAVLPAGVVISNLLGAVITPPLVMAFVMVYKVLKGKPATSLDEGNVNT